MSAPPRLLAGEQATGGERETLVAFLDGYRDIVVAKAAGLSDEAARRHLVPSATTVGGLVKHLRWAEHGWFGQVLRDRTGENQRSHGREWEFDFRTEESLPVLVAEYQQQCAESRRAATGLTLEHTVPHTRLGAVSLRWIYLHMIEETARHAGHLDILREQLDGATGFGP